ncbi:hypothetical protein N8878_05850 [Psychromonas sp.]|nr:hypothetical protein [Psychromonas sp.]
MFRIVLIIVTLLLPIKLIAQSYPILLSQSEIETLANLIWENEGAGSNENLTVWNRNENFPSLGIGHFIWYPTEQKGPYIEQFPQFINYLVANKIILPDWLIQQKTAPWQTREIFYDEFNGVQLTQLRKLMQDTVSLQATFIIKRLEKGIPDILNASTEQEKIKINKSLSSLTSSPEGIFVLLDYINFKGEGISTKERYQGYGWGLKQVLLAMPDNSENPILSFALSADEMLTRRVKNAPRDEFNWLKGWRVRLYKYPLLEIE